jgi:preprotein translocase subunit Sec61beta
MPRSQSELPKVAIKIDPKISVGLGTVVGILGAIVQYLGALALILVPGDLTPEAITSSEQSIPTL